MIFLIDTNEKSDIRLDIFLANEIHGYSRSYISELISSGNVSVNDRIVKKASYKTKISDVINVTLKEIEVLDIEEENIPINIIYEDDDILIINKEKGMVVHPSFSHYKGTLVNAIMYHCKNNLSSINGVIRPGIVHRIDKDTSGILCICKNDNAHKDIALQFSNHTNIRKYYAVVRGVLKDDSGIINEPIGRDKRDRKKMAVVLNGKEAITEYKVLERFNNYTFVECNLKTGRTHQIRVHMKHIGYPLLGDLVYGKVDKHFKELNGQILHAYYLKFIHPTTKKEIEFKTEIPSYMNDILNKIRLKNQV